MADDSRVIDKGWDTLPEYTEQSGDTEDTVTLALSSSTTGEWLVNPLDSVVVPMSTEEVVEALRIHKLTDRSLVWRNGMSEWTAIDRVPSLKLAARMPATLGPKPSRASSPAPAARAAATPSKPPPASQLPHPTPTPQLGLSRRSTMPFGMPGPNPSRPPAARSSSPPAKLSSPPAKLSSPPAKLSSSPAKPSSPPTKPSSPPTKPSSPPAKPSSPPAAAPISARSEEPEVLAVYDRPAATISFDLSPSEPARVPPPAEPARAAPPPPPPPMPPPQTPMPPPQTLAPTTSDARSAPRPTPPPPSFNADLSVVAAYQYRDVQRASKRRLLVSSLASAAAASALTLWLSGGAPWSRPARSTPAPRPPEAAAAVVVPAPPAAVPSPPSQALAPATAAPSAAPQAPVSTTPLPQAEAPIAATPQPAAPKPKAVSATPRVSQPSRTAQRDPKAESNPYDVKLDEDAAAPAGKPARGLLEMMQESERKPPEAKPPEASAATGSSSPGF